MKTGKFEKPTPKFFVTHGLSFNYDPNAKCDKFESFLNTSCEGLQDRKIFLKSFAWALIHRKTEFQIFVFVYGPGGTGKSTLANILTAMVGKAATVTTSLKRLQSDTFEVSNLVGKSLILLSDTEEYKGCKYSQTNNRRRLPRRT